MLISLQFHTLNKPITKIFMPNRSPDSTNPQAIWFDSDLLDAVTAEWFTADYWRQQHLLSGQAKGRGTTYFFNYHHHEFVLRHYKRGGLIGKILSDQYWYSGLHKTRAWRELHLLLKLQELSLPAPRPVAAMVERHFGYYTADIITERIPNAEDVHHILIRKKLNTNVWHKIGKTIATFHQHQIYHHDLNIHNIMLDNQYKPWLIDFDKCGVKAGDDWKQTNISRLKRSLEKEAGMIEDYQFDSSDWTALIDGYKS